MIEFLMREWKTNNNINLFLLDALNDEALNVSVPNGGRSTGQMFRHMVEVRNQWLGAIDTALVASKLPKQIDVETLVLGFKSSGAAVVTLIERVGKPEAKVKGFKSDLVGFIHYLTSHDAHHRGQILLTLRLGGRRLEPKLAYALWDWPARASDPSTSD